MPVFTFATYNVRNDDMLKLVVTAGCLSDQSLPAVLQTGDGSVRHAPAGVAGAARRPGDGAHVHVADVQRAKRVRAVGEQAVHVLCVVRAATLNRTPCRPWWKGFVSTTWATAAPLLPSLFLSEGLGRKQGQML